MKLSLKTVAVLFFVVSALFLLVAVMELFNANRERALTAFLTAAFFGAFGVARLRSWRAQQTVGGDVRNP
jgi:hypothetical protein